MNAGDLVQDRNSYLIGAPDAVSYQAYIRWTDTQLAGDTGIKSKVQFVKVKQTFPVQIFARVFVFFAHVTFPLETLSEPDQIILVTTTFLSCDLGHRTS